MPKKEAAFVAVAVQVRFVPETTSTSGHAARGKARFVVP
jgi:hypothetical protein